MDREAHTPAPPCAQRPDAPPQTGPYDLAPPTEPGPRGRRIFPAGVIPTSVPEEARCVVCSYMLRGLETGGKCPECGTPVVRSIQGNLLRFSSEAYLAALHNGVFIILTSIIVQFLLLIGGILLGIVVAMYSPTAARSFTVGLQLASVAISLALLLGWWMFSAPDPAVLGVNTGATARQVVRITLIINAIATLVNASFEVIAINSPQAQAILLTFAFIALIAWAVQFFASMRYVQWLAPRLPNEHVYHRARLLMWLGPLLYTIGALACGIGPLIALVLYWNMLDWVRRDIRSIREDQQGALT